MQLSDGTKLRAPNVLPAFVKEAMIQIKNKVYATKKPEEFMETLTILAATLILPESEVVRRVTDRTHGKQPYKYLDIASDVYALKGMVPGDKFEPTTFNVNGWILNNQDEEDTDEAQLEEEIKTLKESLKRRPTSWQIPWQATTSLKKS